MRHQEVERKKRELERKRHALEAQIRDLRADFSADEEEMMKLITQVQAAESTKSEEERVMRQRREGIQASRNTDASSASHEGSLGKDHDSNE
jgi:citrate synthase